ASNPRTILLSTHLIDEISDLLEHVVLVDNGQVMLDSPAEDVRGSAVTVSGPVQAVDEFVQQRRVWHRRVLGSRATATVAGTLDATENARAAALQLSVEPLSLQQLMMHTPFTPEQEEVSA